MTKTLKNQQTQSSNLPRIISGVFTIVTFLTLLLAVFSNLNVNKQLKIAKEQSETLKSIVKKIPTKCIGRFPKQMKTITEAINRAQKSLTIAVDFPAYGCFSAPYSYDEYLYALDQKILKKKFDFTLITYSDELCKEKFRQQFDIPNSKWEDPKFYEEKFKKENEDKIKNFFAYLLSTPMHKQEKIKPEEVKTCAELFSYIEKLGTSLINSVKKYGKVQKKIDKELSIYFWIIDSNDKAIISFHIFGKNTHEKSFCTLDPDLIQFLNDVKEGIIDSDKKNGGIYHP